MSPRAERALKFCPAGPAPLESAEHTDPLGRLPVAYRGAAHGNMRALRGEKPHTLGRGLSKAVNPGAPTRPTGTGLQPHDSRLVTGASVARRTAEHQETTLQGSQARCHHGPVCRGQGSRQKPAGGPGAAVPACAQRKLSFPERSGSWDRKQ